MAGRYLEDFSVGELIVSPETYEMTPERLNAYASEYDPQGIHLDPDVAERELFGTIIASGWHSLSATMRLIVLADPLHGGPLVGVGIDKLRFLAPVHPGDVLSASAEVGELRPSRTDRTRGYLVLRITTINQHAVPVLTQQWTLVLPRREAEATEAR